jgi:hypothetical protein
MINPLIRIPFVVLYGIRSEANAEHQYRVAFPLMINTGGNIEEGISLFILCSS